jgi:hypothetical protein
MLLDGLEKAYNSAIIKGWDKIYIAVDIHDTIVHGNYVADVLPTEFLVGAKQTLQYLSKRADVCLILYTCSHPYEIVKYQQFFSKHGINFQYANCNPEVPNNALGCYTDKLYFNLLLDDKAGFIEADWLIIFNFFKSKQLLVKSIDKR